jgi:hypothetical protein
MCAVLWVVWGMVMRRVLTGFKGLGRGAEGGLIHMIAFTPSHLAKPFCTQPSAPLARTSACFGAAAYCHWGMLACNT